MDQIIDQSLSKLSEFDFVDIYENRGWLDNFHIWLGSYFEIYKENETEIVPHPYQSCMKTEITSETLEFMEDRTRIDKAIWHEIGSKILGHAAMENLKESIELDSIKKFAKILSGE
ncbi:hypothetical protein TomTYG75_07400 [Sphingobium sp. TomTYG75]